MFLNDKKRSISVILSKVGKDGRVSENDIAAESGEQDEYTALAEDLLNAFHKRSVQGLAQALRTFHEIVKEEDIKQDLGG